MCKGKACPNIEKCKCNTKEESFTTSPHVNARRVVDSTLKRLEEERINDDVIYKLHLGD